MGEGRPGRGWGWVVTVVLPAAAAWFVVLGRRWKCSGGGAAEVDGVVDGPVARLLPVLLRSESLGWVVLRLVMVVVGVDADALVVFMDAEDGPGGLGGELAEDIFWFFVFAW